MPDHLIVTEVPHDFASTVQSITEALRARRVTVFATIDHAGGARAAGLELDDEMLLVFGNPAVGTPLMVADPTAGIDLPLRMLVWSRDGTTRIAYEDPFRLVERYAVDAEVETLGKLRGLVEQLVGAASAQAR